MAKKADWIKIKNEYINTEISQRKLAEKYGVSFPTLRDRAKKEGWKALKDKQRDKIMAMTSQKAAEKIVEKEVDRISSIFETADTMQDKIVESLSQLTTYIDMFGNSHESDIIDVNRLKKLVSALKDIKDIKGVKSEIDIKEQNARIDRLRMEIDGQEVDNTITVTFAEEVKKYGD